MKNSLKLEIDLNSENDECNTAFHQACLEGHSEIAKMIMKNSSKLDIWLNTINEDGNSAFYIAWVFKIFVEMMIEQSDSLTKNSFKLKNDLNSPDDEGNTAFHTACELSHSEMAKMIMQNSSTLEIDLNIKMMARQLSTLLILEMMIEQSDAVELDLKAKNNDNKTGYQLAKEEGEN
jgi:ankyrin repeat protein